MPLIRSTRPVIRLVGAAAAATLLMGAAAGTRHQGSARAETPLRMGPVDMAPAAGLSVVTRTFDVQSGDWNRDGFPDLLVVPHDPDALRQGVTDTSRPLFYQNDGDGTFSPKSTAFGGRDRHGCAFGDMNNDERLDFFCTIGYNGRTNKELGLQRSDGSFADYAYYRNLYSDGAGRYRTVGLFDANGDDYLDIYLTHYYGPSKWDGNHVPAEDPPKPNEFWLNHGGSYFTHEPSFGLDLPIGVPQAASSCAQGADYDNDGRQDLLVCGAKKLILHHNDDNESFSIPTSVAGIGGDVMDAELADLNGDEYLDLVKTTRHVFSIRLGDGDGWPALTYSTAVEEGQGVATGDFNGDGRADVYLIGTCSVRETLRDRPDYLFVNQGGGQFRLEPIPALPRTRGCGDAVAATDYDQDGLTDFVEVNGRKKRAGPIRLWSYKQQG